MENLKLYWPNNKVLYQGKSLSQAWREEVARVGGFESVDSAENADLAFFISDSVLDDQVLGRIPSLVMFWGFMPDRLLYRDYQDQVMGKINQMAHTTRILVPSLTTRDQACCFGLPTQICLPGVDGRSLQMAGYTRKKNQVMFIGRFDEPYKGLQQLIEAVGICPLSPKPELLVCGPGEPGPFLQLANSMGVQIRFAQLSDADKARELRSSRLLVHPSNYEGFGMPPLEALYVGTPVLCFDSPQLRHVCQEYAYYAGSVESFAGMIAHVLTNELEADAMARAGKKYVQNALTLEAAANRLWAHMHQAFKEHYGALIRQDPGNRENIKIAYEAEHRRNGAYGLAKVDVTAPARFDPTWSRHWRAQHFIKALHDAGAKNIVDIGCSAVYPTIFAKAGFTVTGVDVSSEALRQVHELGKKWGVDDKITTCEAYAQKLPFPDNTFDSAVLGEILEHVLDPEVCVAEAMRVIKPGGRIVASTPMGEHHWDPMHIASEHGGWSEDMIDKLLKPYEGQVILRDKVAEGGADPSCYLFILEKK